MYAEGKQDAEAVERATAAAVNNTIYVFGGRDVNGQPTGTLRYVSSLLIFIYFFLQLLVHTMLHQINLN